MKKTWKIKESNLLLQRSLAATLNISPVTAQLLANRGISDAAEANHFLNTSLSYCHDPFLMKGMDRAVERIRTAVRTKERILVYGDYDVDGITGVAVLMLGLRRLGAEPLCHIPNRLEEGYGLNLSAIKKAHKDGVGLIITVDCGIASFKEIEHAAALGIDVVITDHHEILEGRIPAAHAVINPLQEGCRYPFKHLAGVGIAYKLIKALYENTAFFAEDFLDLVSMGTVADIVPLIGENRVIAKYGLAELNRRERIGLKALMDVSGLSDKDISCGHIGFALGPRINAMGRIGSPLKALDLILTEDKAEAERLAKVLDSENRARQKLEGAILEEALARVEREVNFKHHRVIVLAHEGWHQGVIGIVASRIAERYYRPTIMISLDGKYGKGSGRSIDGFHLFEYLLRCKDLLAGFGGHESACGLTIEKDKVDAFRERINHEAAQEMGEGLFSPQLDIEMDVPLGALSDTMIHELESLAPFGEENPRPVLASRNLRVKDNPRPIGKNGFKMLVTDDRITCEAVSFGRQNLSAPRAGGPVDVAYIPSINDWQGVQSIQLELKDIR